MLVWLLAAVVVVVAALDLVTPTGVVVLAFMWVPVVASVALDSPRATAWLAVWAGAGTIIVGFVQGYFDDPTYWVRFGAMALTALIVVYLASQVADREQRLDALATIFMVWGFGFLV